MAEVALTTLGKRFGDIVAVDDLSLAIPDGGFFVLLGPSGAGKTTTLRLVAGLERPDRGTVAIGGRDMTAAPPAARDVAFVFQQYSLYPHFSVFDNLAFPLRSPLRRMPAAEIRQRVGEIAALLHIEDKLASPAARLSGGQMQRVAIGRALVRRPAIYLMDEPLSSLDAKLRAELRLEIKRIQQELGATVLYVTHDQTEAMTMADTVGVMQEGRLVQIGSPRAIYEDPDSVYVATRLGLPAMNLLARGLFPALAAPPEAATIGVRTEHLRISRAHGGDGTGTVTWIEHLGDHNHLHLQLGASDVVSLADPDSGLGVGDSVMVDLDQPLFFAADGQRIRA
jgi:multiple sugar transport system ATP-binding protein